MKLSIPSKSALCKNCLKLRELGSSYCKNCKQLKRPPVYIDEQKNFPLLEKAKKIFPINENTIFTYGNTIYTNNKLPYHLITHETTHIIQQGKHPRKWWNRYFKEVSFRLVNEIEAYQRQYEAAKRVSPLEAKIILEKVSKDLSSELYGYIISKEQAKNEITSIRTQ